jgi:ribosome biogenesis GTPase
MSLEKFGWNSYFESEFSRFAGEGVEPARVVLADRERFVVWSGSAEHETTVAGRLRYESDDWPTVGDWVALEAGTRISAVLPRQSVFSRKEAGAVTREQVIAANIDVLFVVTGLDGDFNLRRIERYLLLAWESGAKPVVVLTRRTCVQHHAAAADVRALAPRCRSPRSARSFRACPS